MKKTKGFSKIQRKNKILGLEFFDFLLLIMLYLVVFLFSKNFLVNVGILMSAYFVLRVYKKGKPPHWTSSLVRFILTRRRYSPAQEKEKEIF